MVGTQLSQTKILDDLDDDELYCAEAQQGGYVDIQGWDGNEHKDSVDADDDATDIDV